MLCIKGFITGQSNEVMQIVRRDVRISFNINFKSYNYISTYELNN